MTTTDNTSPTGGAWAAILAAAIGCFIFAVATDLSEMSKQHIGKLLSFYRPSGDLSGKSTIGVIVWLAAWGILHAQWKGRDIRRTGTITFISVVLILISLALVFPEFVELIESH